MTTQDWFCEQQEKIDYAVVSAWIRDNAKGLVSCERLPRKAPADCEMQAQHSHNIIEIKSRKRDAKSLEKWPVASLKQTKYEAIKDFADNGDVLWLFHILNEHTLYIFNITDIEKCEGVTLTDWNVKKVQYSPTSPVVTVPTYELPYANAHRTADVSAYYTEYYNQHPNALYFQA